MKHSNIPAVVLTLISGKEMMATRGLSQGRYNGKNGEVCPVQAIRHNVAAHAYLEKALPFGYYSVPSYADATTTTIEKIFALFDRAIEIALNEEQYSTACL
jgi:hypothetical protein